MVIAYGTSGQALAKGGGRHASVSRTTRVNVQPRLYQSRCVRKQQCPAAPAQGGAGRKTYVNLRPSESHREARARSTPAQLFSPPPQVYVPPTGINPAQKEGSQAMVRGCAAIRPPVRAPPNVCIEFIGFRRPLGTSARRTEERTEEVCERPGQRPPR